MAHTISGLTPIAGGRLHAAFDREAYCRAVERVKDHVARGDIFQANLSQRFRQSITSSRADMSPPPARIPEKDVTF